MVDARREVDLWRLERVVCGEVDGQEEDTARVWGVSLRSNVSITKRVYVCVGWLGRSREAAALPDSKQLRLCRAADRDRRCAARAPGFGMVVARCLQVP